MTHRPMIVINDTRGRATGPMVIPLHAQTLHRQLDYQTTPHAEHYRTATEEDPTNEPQQPTNQTIATSYAITATKRGIFRQTALTKRTIPLTPTLLLMKSLWRTNAIRETTASRSRLHAFDLILLRRETTIDKGSNLYKRYYYYSRPRLLRLS